MTKRNILRISVFYLLGISLSNVFRFDLLEIGQSEEQFSVVKFILCSPLQAIGLIIGALISMHLLKKERKLSYSLFGTSRILTSLMLIVPVVLLGILGVENKYNLNTHYYGIIGAITNLIYCFCEEAGWRGYLQDELKIIKKWQSVLLIGFLWYLWHLGFLINQDLQRNLQFLGWLIFGSWGIGTIIDKTRSILAATCFHMLINTIMFNSTMSSGIENSAKLYFLGISVALWIPILIIWSKQSKNIGPHELKIQQL